MPAAQRNAPFLQPPHGDRWQPPQRDKNKLESIFNTTQQGSVEEEAGRLKKKSALVFYLSVSSIQKDFFNVIIVGITPI